MLNVTRLLCGQVTSGDGLRYGDRVTMPDAPPAQERVHHRPIVVWNTTRRCNLRCLHCYTASVDKPFSGELSTEEGRAMVEDLARYRVPVILFSGGEPLLRPDLLELVALARSRGVRPGLSSNGTLLTRERVVSLKGAGLATAGISIDGAQATNDRFRGKEGAFQEALSGIRFLLEAGMRVSLRLTMTRYNVADLDAIFDLVEEECIPRLCIYHLAYAGRGRRLLDTDLDHQERRKALDTIFQRTIRLYQRNPRAEVLTVDNHADGAYLLLWARENAPQVVAEAYRLLLLNGGNSSGTGIAAVDERGFVHADQFWRTRSLGNVRERPFSHIWSDESNPLLHALRHRGPLLKGRCPACPFLSICNGNLRVRAEMASGDTWAQDPACYLTDDETGGEGARLVHEALAPSAV